MQKVIILWKNKQSGQEGYVKDVLIAQGHIVAAFDKNDAKSYAPGYAKKLISKMAKLNMEQQNEYTIEPVMA